MRRFGLLLSGLVFIATTVAVEAPASAGPVQSCDTTATKVNNIHVGDIAGSNSVKVVGQIRCTQQVDEIHAYIYLFFCGDTEPPYHDQDWNFNHCTSYERAQQWAPFPANDTQTIRAPKNADAPVCRTGWYTSDMEFIAYNGDQIKKYAWYWAPNAPVQLGC